MNLTAATVSYAQQSLWLQAELSPGNPAFHVPVALRLRGHIDAPALAQAMNEIVRRHEALRTTFAVQGGELLQIIHEQIDVPFSEQPVPGADTLDAAIRETIREPFDLVNGPLLRGRLFRLAEDEAVLVVTMHHLVTDGWSMGVMIRDFGAYYRAITQGEPLTLDDLEIQYADFAEWQREQVEGQWSAQLDYWKRRLQGPLSLTALPVDFSGLPGGPETGASEHWRVPHALLAQVKRVAEQQGATLFMVLLAAFKVLVYRYNHQPDVIIGSPIANRNQPEIENLIGYFVNTQVLRTDLSGNPSFAELLGRVRETTLGAWECQDVPFEWLVNTLRPERNLGQTPFFQIMFALQNANSGVLELPGLSIERLDVSTEAAKFDLTWMAEETQDGLALHIEYRTSLFLPETIQQLARHYQHLLAAIVENPACEIDRLELLSADERHRLLAEWPGGSASFSADLTLDGWFRRQAAKTPHRAAVSFLGETLTYAELDRRSDRLADRLAALLCAVRHLGLHVDLAENHVHVHAIILPPTRRVLRVGERAAASCHAWRHPLGFAPAVRLARPTPTPAASADIR